jgi:hypothetical protein
MNVVFSKHFISRKPEIFRFYSKRRNNKFYFENDDHVREHVPDWKIRMGL